MVSKRWQKWKRGWKGVLGEMVSVRTASRSWKTSDGKKRAENGSNTVNKVHPWGQDSFTSPFGAQGRILLQHSALFCTLTPQRHRGFGEVIIWVWSCETSHAASAGCCSGLGLLLPLQCMPAVLQWGEALTASCRWRRASASQAQKPCKEDIQRYQLSLYFWGDS